MNEYAELFDGLEIELNSNRLVIEGASYNLQEFRREFFAIVGMVNPKAIELVVMEKAENTKYKTTVKNIFEAIKKELKPDVESSIDTGAYETLRPIVDMDTDEVYLMDEENSLISEIKYNPWLRSVSPDFKKAILSEAIPMARFIFDPYDHTKLRKETIDNDSREMVVVNQYEKPHWMYGVNPSPECPGFLTEFMEHLLPDKEQIKYCLSWMAESVFGRNETYLVLNGDKGVGKNTLYEIMKAVNSPRYSVIAPQSLTTSHFNSVLKDKRLILLDEYKITRGNQLFLKKIINKGQTIEMKGFDANTEIETFNSFMVFHNAVSDMYLERDDRRFSVLDITDKSLLSMWTPEYIRDLITVLEDPRSGLVKSIGEYLMWIHQNVEFKNNTPFKGAKFHEIVEYHMPLWLRVVIAMIENGEVKKGEISFKKEIEKRTESAMLGSKKIQWRASTLAKVLKEYRYKDLYSIGSIEKGKGKGASLILKVNPSLLEHFGYDTDNGDAEEGHEDLEDIL